MAASPLIEILPEIELVAVSGNTAELRSADGTARHEAVAAVVVAQGREPNGDLVPQLRALAYGYVEGFRMERLVRDVLVLPIWGGSSAIQRNNLASLLGLPRG